MSKHEWLIRAVSIACFVAGFMLPWWPLMFIGVLVSAVYGGWILALVLAATVDLMFGSPTGLLHMVAFPFTLTALCIVVARVLIIRHLR